LGSLAGPRLGITQDISLGGMRFSSTDRMQPGDKVAVNLTLPREGPVSIMGVVVWSRPSAERGPEDYEAGLRWFSVNAHAQARLNSFVTDYTRSRSVPIAASRIAVTPSILWVRAVILSLTIFSVAATVFAFWQERLHLRSEIESLRTVADNYRNQVEYLSQQRSGSY
jgi:hypothetical protein